jgi:anti-sigma factor RsiW
VTSGHITEERIMELALDEAHEPGNGEARHLASCASCAALLEEERGLTARIREIAPTRMPPGFPERAVARFVEAVTARNRRHVGLALGLLAGIGAGVAASLALACWQVIGSLAALAGSLAAVTRAAGAIACSVPVASVVFVAVLCAVALACCWSLAAMARNRGAVKYPARPGVRPSGETR